LHFATNTSLGSTFGHSIRLDAGAHSTTAHLFACCSNASMGIARGESRHGAQQFVVSVTAQSASAAHEARAPDAVFPSLPAPPHAADKASATTARLAARLSIS
jgi:hypothetical protein